jgi:methylglutaconyl-CoA hydratase
MQKSIGYGEAENARDAKRLAGMFQAVDHAPCVVIARVQGAALGGGAGLAACCDIVVAESGAKLGFTEARLGLIPAVISPFVIRRIGPSRARRYFLTGEIFSAEEGRRIGLCDELAPTGGLDRTIDAIAQAVLRCGPHAVDAAKRLIRVIEASDSAAAHTYAADTIAALRVQPEAQEGMRAFLEKREPRWQ